MSPAALMGDGAAEHLAAAIPAKPEGETVAALAIR